MNKHIFNLALTHFILNTGIIVFWVIYNTFFPPPPQHKYNNLQLHAFIIDNTAT
jgi:hypothetical protein